MAYSGDTLPNFDPFDSSYIENFFGYHENPNFNSVDILSEPSSFPASIPRSGDCGVDAFDPLYDSPIWEMCDSRNVENPEAAHSEIRGETNNAEEGNTLPAISGFGNSMQLSIRPQPPVPFHCSFCQVLREIIHTNGNHATKLEIHGRLGMICHAILENQQNGQQCQMFDFCNQSMESVKQFLLQYCEERKQAGYVMLQDPLLIFYEALCTGLDCDEDLNMDDFFQPSPVDLDPSGSSEEFRVNEPETEDHAEKMPKSSLAVQRERAAKLTMRDVGKYFHVPIEEAAKKVGVCPTVVKKICRKNGVYRWPHRKIKSIERKLSILKASLNSTDTEVRARAQEAIERLREKMNDIYVGFTK